MVKKSPPTSAGEHYKATIGALVFSVAAFAILYASALVWPSVDFWHLWAIAAEASKGDANNIYSRSASEGLYDALVPTTGPEDFTSREKIAALQSASMDSAALGYRGLNVIHTPLPLALVRVISTGDYERDNRWFLAVSLVCFFVSVFVLSRLVGFSVPISFLAAAALGLTLDAESSELRVLNINNIQLALVVAFLLFQRRRSMWADFASGAVLALATALKPNVVLVVAAVFLTWIGSRLWRKLLYVCSGLTLGVLMVVVLTSTSAWRAWFRALPEFLHNILPLEQGNFGLSAVIAEQLGFEASSILLMVGLFVLAIVALWPLWSRASLSEGMQVSFDRTFFSVSAGATLTILSSPLVWIHYVILATPAILLLAHDFMDQRGLRSWVSVLAMLPLTAGCMTLLRNIGGTFMWAAVALNLSLVVLFTRAMASLWHSGKQLPSSTNVFGIRI